MRHFWGTTPATPAARDGRHNSTRGATPVTRRHTPYVAPHPLRGTAPLTRQCTRYEAVHPLRGSAPDQKGCNAYGSGAAPPITRTNAESARRGPGCGARGRWRGLAGQRTNNEPDRLEAAAGPAGPGRASSRRAERSSRRGQRAGGPPPTGAPSSPARRVSPNGTRNTSGAASNKLNREFRLRRRCGGRRRVRRARLRRPWAAAGPGRASIRRAEP